MADGMAIPGVQILGKLGAGGTGSVFRGLHVQTNVPVAVKILYPKLARDPMHVKRFVRESQLLIEFHHAVIVRGMAHGEAGGLHYMVMELVKGQSVMELLDLWEGAIAEKVALKLVRDVAEALDYMWSRGVLHKDIKPGNIILTEKGKAKLCDLGFAAPMRRSNGATTHSEVTVGTREYISPEQAQGENEIDITSDIYSLGATLYHMVTGKMPKNDPLEPEVRRRSVLEGIANATNSAAGLTDCTRYFILKAMARDRTKRFARPRQIAVEIQQFLDGVRTFGKEAWMAQKDL
ncbi:MAG: serine/threonine protein kinase [Planctomycetes bacterium]|nr:serine/threonine protein kinase [Planctomycetota bacterium]